MQYIHDIEPDALRTAIDHRQLFEVMQERQVELSRRYGGSMRHAFRGDKEYLLRRHEGSKSDRSLGPRTEETEITLERFRSEKAKLEAAVNGGREQLEKKRKLIIAHGLARFPNPASRILRKLDAVGWLGTRLLVVGTNALFAYEARAGVRIEAAALATRAVDVLHDARRKTSLGGVDLPEGGLLGVLVQVDRSYLPLRKNGFRASNKDGYLVDLIEPIRGNGMKQKPSRLSDHDADMEAIAIEGLEWLINAPKFETVAFDDKGLPLRLVTIDPRVFALHKLWISQREDRAPEKRSRDLLQSKIAATIARDHLNLDFESTDLSAIPGALRAMAAGLEFESSDNESLW